MINGAVPRGTHPGNDLVNWQADLAARETDAASETAYFDRLRADRIGNLNGSAHAAGMAHVDRLAVDGGTVTGGHIISQHPTLQGALAACGLVVLVVAALYGAFLLAWTGE